MSLFFEVETGTGSATATSFATVAQARQYNDNIGKPYATSDTDAKIQGYLNAASIYINTSYRFKGVPRFVNTQALQWPRILVNQLGTVWNYMAYRIIKQDEIPHEVIEATCYLAYEAKRGSLITVDEGVIQRSFGPVSSTFSKGEGNKNYPYINRLFRFLVTSSVGMSRVN